MAIFQRSSYCIVTGASSGLGRALSILLAREWSKAAVPANIVLLARNEELLKEVKHAIESECSGVTATVVVGDLGKLETIDDVCRRAMMSYDASKYEQGLLVHNAGSLGDIWLPTAQQTDALSLQGHVMLNYTSMALLTSHFLSSVATATIVNMTSMAGNVSMGGLGTYCSLKSARNSFFKCLALEYPNVRLLSYSPGPCKTQMFTDFCTKAYINADKEGPNLTPLAPEDSMAKLIQLLREDSYSNGDFIDILDCK